MAPRRRKRWWHLGSRPGLPTNNSLLALLSSLALPNNKSRYMPPPWLLRAAVAFYRPLKPTGLPPLATLAQMAHRRPKKTTPADKRHGPAVYPAAPPPPPQYTVLP